MAQEFQGALTDYNGIMLPTLNLANEGRSDEDVNNSRAFIQQANNAGWIMVEVISLIWFR